MWLDRLARPQDWLHDQGGDGIGALNGDFFFERFRNFLCDHCAVVGAKGVGIGIGGRQVENTRQHRFMVATEIGAPVSKLISSLTINAGARAFVGGEIAVRLNAAKGPVHMFMPLGGVEAWDSKGEIGHAPDGLAKFCNALRAGLSPDIPRTELDCHINAPEFVAAVMGVFDDWVARGIVPAAAAPVTICS